MAVSRYSVIAALSLLVVSCKPAIEPKPLQATHPAGVLADSIAISGRPHGLTIAPDNAFCVSQIDGNSVTCGTLSATSIALGPVIAVGATPAHVALDPSGRIAYAANQSGNTSSIVDVSADHVVATVTLGDRGFNVIASRTRGYVTTATGKLIIIDANTRQSLVTLAVGSAANGLAIDTLAGMLYVSSRDAGTVTAINTNTNSVTRTYTVGTGAQRVALSLDRNTLYIASEGSGAQVLDLASGQVAAIPGVSTGSVGLALSPDGARLYITNPLAGTVQIVDPSSRRVLATLNGLGRPRNVAFGANGKTALVTNEFGELMVIR